MYCIRKEKVDKIEEKFGIEIHTIQKIYTRILVIYTHPVSEGKSIKMNIHTLNLAKIEDLEEEIEKELLEDKPWQVKLFKDVMKTKTT